MIGEDKKGSYFKELYLYKIDKILIVGADPSY